MVVLEVEEDSTFTPISMVESGYGACRHPLHDLGFIIIIMMVVSMEIKYIFGN